MRALNPGWRASARSSWPFWNAACSRATCPWPTTCWLRSTAGPHSSSCSHSPMYNIVMLGWARQVRGWGQEAGAILGHPGSQLWSLSSRSQAFSFYYAGTAFFF